VERQLAPLRKGTFARDFADTLRAEIPARAHTHTVPATSARKRR
jgi:hypothetical protein